MVQTTFDLGVSEHAPRACASPVCRWAGGKRWAVPVLARGIHRELCKTGGKYVEPFLGGAAMALNLGLPGMILGDACAPLIETYRAILISPESVAGEIALLTACGLTEAAYYMVRASKPTTMMARAARFLYLNKLCFNGIYRSNRKGEFNVPWGGEKTTSALPSLDELEAFLRAFSGGGVVLSDDDFRDTLAYVHKGDVAFVDSPYYGTFDTYVAGGFPEAAHVELAAHLEYLAHDVGATVFMTNSDCDAVRKLYAWADIIPTAELRSVNRDGEGRGRKGCVLVTNRMDLVGVE